MLKNEEHELPETVSDSNNIEMKVFNDFVHGHMPFHPLLVAIIDTPQFQRLRNIKQLGLCYFVFPAACHNRFEHCLGTSYIAGRLLESFEKRINVRPDWEKEKLCIQVAGLCHDIGHGPFSHTWEIFLRKLNKPPYEKRWTHEEESIKIFEEILEEKVSSKKRFNGERLNTVRDVFKFYKLTEDDISDIKLMINGKKNSKDYKFQIINNKDNHIDVDKWEYLKRDSVMLNVPIEFDYENLLYSSSIKKTNNGGEELCFRKKEVLNLIGMFQARAKLHILAYQNSTTKIIEEMLVDAFLAANNTLKFSETPVSRLTDYIYYKILYEDFEKDENMEKAKQILRRIERRDLYKIIASKTLKSEIDLDKVETQLDRIRLLGNSDFGVTVIKVDLTKTNRNKVLENVLVYDDESESSFCTYFDGDNFMNALNLNLNYHNKYKMLLFHKGEEELTIDLKRRIVIELNQILDESTL